jgi:hypothetical protein
VSRYEDYEEGQFQAEAPQATKPSGESSRSGPEGKSPRARPPQGPHSRPAENKTRSSRPNSAAEGS